MSEEENKNKTVPRLKFSVESILAPSKQPPKRISSSGDDFGIANAGVPMKKRKIAMLEEDNHGEKYKVFTHLYRNLLRISNHVTCFRCAITTNSPTLTFGLIVIIIFIINNKFATTSIQFSIPERFSITNQRQVGGRLHYLPTS